MKRLTGSLFGRIAASYLMLLSLFCLISIVVTVDTSRRFLQESDQLLNRTLGEYLAGQIAPFIEDSLDRASVEHAMHDIMAQNPRVEIYLLDAAGNVMMFAADADVLKTDRVETAPIQDFLNDPEDLPVLGPDPRSEDAWKIFSAHPVKIADEPGYVYIILRGTQLESAAAMVKDSYILRAAALFLVIVFLFSALAGLMLFALLTKRVQRIVRSVRAFQAGHHAERIHTRGTDELAQIEEAFNEMAGTIEATVEELNRREDFRREFIANISHDLKSPLTSIRGYLETTMMKNESLPPEKRLEYLQIVYDETDLLDSLISQLLELSKLDAAGARPHPEPFVVGELVHDVITQFKPLAVRLNVELKTPISHDLPMVEADIGMVERVLANLIDNALRHTPAGGYVIVDGTRMDQGVRISVRDNGSGIHPEDLAHVTERFYKGRGNGARTPRSTGLGLAIARRILELHGSDIEIESELGEGTNVSFTLRTAGMETEVLA